MKPKRGGLGRLLTVGGALLIAAALGLTAYNLWTERRAARRADSALEQLVQTLPAPPAAQPETNGETVQTIQAELVIPDYVLDPTREMPAQTLDGNDYIGVLEIPALDLRLPVIDSWSYAALETAPCRYSGSAYTGGLVIAAHNYQGHFGTLKSLSPGDAVTFTDMDGNVFSYEVAALETLQPTDVAEMVSSEWDLSLFTCTVGGAYRLTVRCEQLDSGIEPLG